MAVEIERKFCVVGDAWRAAVTRTRALRQAYLTKNGRISVRVRIDSGATATLTIKTAGAGISRNEYEYAIPVPDAEELMAQREGAVISKVRHIVPVGGLDFEIDVFEGENAGLVVAEVELPHALHALPAIPWLGAEVSGERRYYNADLSKRPFAQWTAQEQTGERSHAPARVA